MPLEAFDLKLEFRSEMVDLLQQVIHGITRDLHRETVVVGSYFENHAMLQRMGNLVSGEKDTRIT